MDKIKELEKQITALKAELKEAKQNRAKGAHFDYTALQNKGDIGVWASSDFKMHLKDVAGAVGTAQWSYDGGLIEVSTSKTKVRDMTEAQIRIGNEFIQDIIPIIRAYSLKAANINGKRLLRR